MRPAWFRAAALVLAAIAAAPAMAEEVPPDSLLQRFLRSLSDSTDAYFGESAAGTDTTGFDSTLAYRLARPGYREPLRLALEIFPWVGFNRVDGGVLGGRIGIGQRSRIGRVTGRVAWANGPDLVLGDGAYEKAFLRRDRREGASWTVGMSAGRLTHDMDREYGEPRLAQIRALLAGTDAKRYLRREGFQAKIERETALWRGSIAWRDHLESALPVTASWNLMDRPLVVPDNLAATTGRALEFELAGRARLGRLPFSAEAGYASSSRDAGSDFEYRRTRLALAGDLAAMGWLAVVPQASYGWTKGDALPQSAFYLGGSRSLRILEGSSLGGTRQALARLDLIAAPDLLELARIPHPDAFPIQAGVFGGSGAVWGRDPYGGPGSPEDPWPHETAWRSEIGASILYRPGVPDPTGFLRLNHAWALGPGEERTRLSVTFTTGLDLLTPRE